MYICVCKAVTDRQVKQAVNDGASSMRDLRNRLGVAGECGRCAKCALDCLREHKGAAPRNEPAGSFQMLPVAA